MGGQLSKLASNRQ